MLRRVLGYLLAQPVNRLLTASFVLVALVPVGFWAAKLYNAAWDDAWREIREKHQLLAQNLAAPISVYVDAQQGALRLAAVALQNAAADRAHYEQVLSTSLGRMTGVRSLSLVDAEGRTLASTDSVSSGERSRAFAKERCYLKTRRAGEPAISGIKPSPLRGDPAIVLSQPVSMDNSDEILVLLAELRIDLIEDLRRNIKFGERGHSAIVDQHGRVIAHPNPDWMDQMRDLSDWPVVQNMMAGKTGVTEFYSPFIESEMVAGYASVPGIGWGVMVPQPKGEVARRVDALLLGQLMWGGFGALMGIALAVALARWITRPINQLAHSANRLSGENFKGHLPGVSTYAPREIRVLNQGIQRLIEGLQGSRKRYDELNRTLQKRIEEATHDLRLANAQLEHLARVDHLTAVANRRFFEDRLAQSLNRRRSDEGPLCLMLLDVDNFKEINDTHGHAGGDAVLMQLASLLQARLRYADLVARYGGDEFVIQMNCDREIGRQRAEELLDAIRQHSFQWHGTEIGVSVSIGVLCRPAGSEVGTDRLLQKVDQAMYEAKSAGRDTVVDITLDG